MLKQFRTVMAVSLLMVFLCSCGYHFSGGGDFPEGISGVYVEMFENKSSESGIEATFTDDMSYKFSRSGKVSIVDRQRADAVFSGVIKSIGVASLTHAGDSTTTERRVTIIVDLKLVGKDGEVVWSRMGLSKSGEYSVDSGDDQKTDENKEDAIEELSKLFSESAYRGITDNF